MKHGKIVSGASAFLFGPVRAVDLEGLTRKEVVP